MTINMAMTKLSVFTIADMFTPVTTDLIMKMESFISKAQEDDDIKTSEIEYSIGYGTRSKPGATITKDEAYKLMSDAIKSATADVGNLLTINPDYIKIWPVVISMTYNGGIGMARQWTAQGTRTVEQAVQKLPEYNKAKGRVNAGLVRRRDFEQRLANWALASARTMDEWKVKVQNEVY